MEEMENLKKKIENKKNDNNKVEIDYVKAIDNFTNNVNKVYEKVCRAEDNLMKKMRFIDSKQDKLLELLQNGNVDVKEIQKQKEIMELENKLKELRGE